MLFHLPLSTENVRAEILNLATTDLYLFVVLDPHVCTFLPRPGLHDIGSLFMPDCFHESDTENAPECGCLHKELY